MFDVFEVTDIVKARTAHKYIRRTGTPGNYRYWYKLPDGRIVDEESMQQAGKMEHAARLVAGKRANHHGMTDEQMAAHVGLTKRQIQNSRSNMDREKGRQVARGNADHPGHDFKEHHLIEAKHPVDIDSDEYNRHVLSAPAEGAVSRRTMSRRRSSTRAAAPAASAAPAEDTRPPSAMQAAASDPTAREAGFRFDADSAQLHRYVTNGSHHITRRGGKFVLNTKHAHIGDTESEHDSVADAVAASRETEAGHRREMARREEPAAPERDPVIRDEDHAKAIAAGFGVGLQTAEKTESLNGIDYRFRLTKQPDRSYKLVITDGGTTVHSGEYANIANAIRRAASEKTTLLSRHRTAVPVEARPQSGPAAGESASADSEKQRKMNEALERLRSRGIDLTPRPAPAEPTPTVSDFERANADRQRAIAASAQAQVRNAAIHPDGSAARALAASEPALAVADAPIREMIAEEARGGNPYLHRAKSTYEKIKGHLKPERKAVADHVFNTIEQLQSAGTPITEASFTQKYKEISGSRIRGLSTVSQEFEKGTFISLDEIINNPPVDIEVERMSRGYGAMQMARLRPYIKQAWHDANPGAPPPFPTFGDLKSWTEHGGKPEWAGNTRMAVPKEVFDANHKSADGKVKYPPPWMPIHMMPVWIYAAKSMEKEQGSSAWASAGGNAPAYAAAKTPQRDQTSPTGWKVDMGAQARSGAEFASQGPEGMIVAAMRKYVQMRGGPNQLTDIPKSKLVELGISHADIFKASKVGAKILTTKIIDPVALKPFIDDEIAKIKKTPSVKKSLSFVVDTHAKFENSSMKKAELIRKIQEIKRKR